MVEKHYSMAQNKSISVSFDTTKFNLSLDRWVKTLESSMDSAMKMVVPKIQEASRVACKVNDGQLKNNIKVKYEKSKGLYTGKIYVSVFDVDYVMFVYYGTGKYAEKKRYGAGGGTYNTWLVPIEKVTKPVNWTIHNPESDRPYYKVHGQPSNHFLNKGLINTKEQTIQTFIETVRKILRGS